MKIVLLVILGLTWGGARWAKADDAELSCATDDECIRQKVDAGYERWERDRRVHRKHRRKAKPSDDDVKPCAVDDDCQRSKLDAVDRENGRGGQED